MPALITLISTMAVLVGIVGIVPQLVTMLKARSAGGQSTLGWSLGASANLALGFVNEFGYHAVVLATGNALSVVGCLMAVGLVRHYRGRGEDDATTASAIPTVAELHTQEFVVLREAVLAEHHRRTGEPALAV